MTMMDDIYTDYSAWRDRFERERLEPPLVRVWDGNWTLFSEIHGEFQHSFSFEELETGVAQIDLPLDHYVAEWIIDHRSRNTKNVHFTFDKDGARWSGKMSSARVTWAAKDKRVLRVSVKHDYEHLKKIRVWPNPFLPAEIQIPKAWTLIGPADWAMATTLHLQLLRKNASLWMIPDDPLDIAQWVNLDMSNWNMVVKPIGLLDSVAPLATISSRFKDFHTAVKDVAADAQLTILCRRYLDGDPQPIPGKTLRHGCLVIEIVDKSGWQTQTAFGGNILTGLQRAMVSIGADGMTEGVHYIEHPDFPPEYSQPGYNGTRPEAPWVVLEDGPYTGVESTEYEYTPPGAVQFVTGGHSMPGVNEAMKATVIGLGGMLGTVLAGQSQLGSVIEAIAAPLYTDTLFAFQAHKMHERIAQSGNDFYFEDWVDGSDRAYTLSALIAMRKAKFDTREKESAVIEMNDGAPYSVGAEGYGDLFLGDRVAVHAAGMPRDLLFVQQVRKLEYTFSEDKRGWEVTLGDVTAKDALLSLYEKWEETAAGLREVGVL